MAMAVMALVLGLAGTAAAFSLNGGSQSLNGNATIDGDDPDPEPALGSGGNDVVRDAVSGYWEWGDRLGDGTNTPVTDAGLQLGGDTLSTNDGTDINLNLNGGDLTGTGTAASFVTDRDSSAGDVRIQNVGTVQIGSISTVRGGDVFIGSSTVPTSGEVRVKSIETCDNTNGRWPGEVAIYGGGDVLISDGAPTPTYGNIVTRHHRSGVRNFDQNRVRAYHNGTFRANSINTVGEGYGGNHARPGRVILQGNWTTGGNVAASGDCIVNSIVTHYKNNGFHNAPAAPVTVSGYQNVTIGSLDTRARSSNQAAGNVTINGITDSITITGSIDLDSSSGTDGNLTLTCGGNIELASLNMNAVGIARLNGTGGVHTLTGALSNLLLTNTGGSGTFQDPYILDQTRLRVPDGQYLFYDWVDGGLNDLLDGKVYRLASLDGTAGTGGLLLDEIPPPPVAEPASLGLIGLALLGLRKRRRA
jgi:hypothetical protein